MGIPQVMHDAMKAFPPTEINKDAAIKAAITSGKRFLKSQKQPMTTQVRKNLQDAAAEVWSLYVRVSTSTLLTPEIAVLLPPLYSQENERDPMVYVKFFHPLSHWTWYATGFDGLDVFLGWVYGDFPEPGHFTLTELEELIGPVGLGIERDEHFTPMRLSEVQKLHAETPPRQPSSAVYFIEEVDVEGDQHHNKREEEQ